MDFASKLKMVRKINNLTQAEFADSLGVSRGYLLNIEHKRAKPTPLFINCLSLMYKVDKDWLTDDNNSDISVLNESTDMVSLIVDKYGQLDDDYKLFVENQINQLLALQKKSPNKQ